ncbi:MAG: MCE family protein [Acidobacteriota bacterium]
MKFKNWNYWILVALLSTTLAGCLTSSLRFTITFEEADNLQPGHLVVYKGVQIGRVVSVDLDPGGRIRVDVEIESDRRELVYQEACFRIHKPFLDTTGKRHIEMEDTNGTRTAIQPGGIVEGADNWLECVLRGAGAKLEGLLLSSEAQAFLESIKETVDSDFRSHPGRRLGSRKPTP